MKKLNILFISTVLLCSTFIKAQENPGITPFSFSHPIESSIPTIVLPSHDFTQDIADAEVFEKQGNYPRFARSFDLDLTMLNSGNWTELANGDRIWRLNLRANGALFTCLFFDNFFLPEGYTFHVYTPDHKNVSGSYTSADNQGNELFSTEFISGSESTIEYFEPSSVKGQGKLRVSSLAHQYRLLPMANDCEVNVICSEGATWLDEKRGVVRILVKEGTSVGYCSGSLINNTALDCKRYILTAFHCGVSATTIDLTKWKFYFNFEATQCTGQLDTYGVVSNVFTGCTKKADSDDNGGDTGSDFLLLQMSATTHPTWWTNVYWNGWNNASTAPVSGSISIHHPNGDNKKISKTTGLATSSSWGGAVAGTHWRVKWGGTTNGWGVTEGGSSGGPLFNSNSQIVGTLTGGGSFCNSVQANGQNQPDAYGKLSYHWTSDGTTSLHQLKPWLDPTNSGVTFLNGDYNPCNGVGITEPVIENLLSIYPNPTNGSFNVSIELTKTNDIDIAVYNIVGQEVSHKKIENTLGGTYNMDLTNNADGVYFIHIKTNNYSVVKNVILLGSK